MVSALTEYNRINRNYQKSLDNANKEAVAKRETAYYEAHVGDAKTPDELLDNPRLYRYIMQAYGLDDFMFAKGMVRKILKDKDFAARIMDPRLQALRDNFAFDVFKDRTTHSVGAITKTIDKYKEMVLEKTVAHFSDPAQQALYFKNKLKELKEDKKLRKKDWSYIILSDKVLSTLVFKAMGSSTAILASKTEVKAKLIEKHFTLEDFTDPARSEKIVKRALAQYDVDDNTNSDSPGACALQLINSTNKSFQAIINDIPPGGY